jgi:malate dehydrogenase (oxaloacetate-decarboxylating)(NADP+)
MERVLTLARKQKPSLEIVGPIHADIALKSAIEAKINILILPTLDTASIAFNMLRVLSGDVVTVGPILLGTARPAHILTSAHTVRGIINMTALAAVQANSSSAAKVL